MSPSNVQGKILSRSRRYLSLLALAIWFSASGAIGVGVGTLLIDLFLGGPDYLRGRWSTSASPAEAITGLLGLAIGMVGGYWSWKQFMLKMGFLAPGQLEELYKSD